MAYISVKSCFGISIHAPTRGATKGFHFMLFVLCYFNPRSHERSDPMASYQRYQQPISIHAPTRGATYYAVDFGKESLISIHAPTRGATLLPMFDDISDDISIHAPTRGATYYEMYNMYLMYISIHAPTRGATISPARPRQQ